MDEGDISPSRDGTRRDGAASPLAAETPQPRAAIGRFSVLGELGRGGYGLVYRAFDPTLERPVAVKLLRDEVADGPARERLVREARAVARLGKHPHVVQVHEAGATPEGHVWIAMELVEGESLERRLAAGPLPWREAAEVVRKVALGLGHAHGVGLVHRDVKPSNVIVDARGDPHITDFGVAKDLESGSDSITRSGSAVGTPAYMSPEQARGLAVDARSDVYGAGALLYALLTGRPPFRAPHVPMLLSMVIEDEPPPIGSAGCRSCPRDLDTVVRKAMAKEPDRRYPSAAALADDLGRVLRGERCRARRPSPLEDVVAYFRRHPSNLLFVAGIVAAGAVTYLYREADLDRRLLRETNRRALMAEELRLRLAQIEAATTTGDKRRICDAAIAEFPGAWQPWHERGLVERAVALEHAHDGDLEGSFRRALRAERYLSVAVAVGSGAAAPLFWRGILRLEDLDDARGGRADLETAADLSPLSGLALVARFAAHADPAAMTAEERAALDEEVARNRGIGALRAQRCAALLGEDAARAIEDGLAAVRAAPLMAAARERLGRALRAAGREIEAEEALEYARRLAEGARRARGAAADGESQPSTTTGAASPP
jgi:hypothetical protein